MNTKAITTACLLAAGVIAFAPVSAVAQAYPAKPIRMIVPFPPGGGVDIIGRLVGKGMADRMGQQVVADIVTAVAVMDQISAACDAAAPLAVQSAALDTAAAEASARRGRA